MSAEMDSTFQASVERGRERLHRSWPGLLATGAVGGIDVSIGLLALLTVERATGSRLLGAPFGYLDVAKLLGCITLGNALGGLGFVTVLRLVQVGSETVRDQRSQAPSNEPRRAA